MAKMARWMDQSTIFPRDLGTKEIWGRKEKGRWRYQVTIFRGRRGKSVGGGARDVEVIMNCTHSFCRKCITTVWQHSPITAQPALSQSNPQGSRQCLRVHRSACCSSNGIFFATLLADEMPHMTRRRRHVGPPRTARPDPPQAVCPRGMPTRPPTDGRAAGWWADAWRMVVRMIHFRVSSTSLFAHLLVTFQLQCLGSLVVCRHVSSSSGPTK